MFVLLTLDFTTLIMPTAEPFHLETALIRIREIQSLLQEGSQPFDESVALFEEATRLITQSRNYLLEAEVKLQKLTDK